MTPYSSITGQLAAPSHAMLRPATPNPAVQLNAAPSAGPGAGGAATAANAWGLLQQQQQVGQPSAAPPAPAVGGFMPNPQGQVVYPPGQGPVTSKVPAMKTAELSEFAQGFVEHYQKHGYSPEQIQQQAKQASQLSEKIAAELEPLVKQSLLGAGFGSALKAFGGRAARAAAPVWRAAQRTALGGVGGTAAGGVVDAVNAVRTGTFSPDASKQFGLYGAFGGLMPGVAARAGIGAGAGVAGDQIYRAVTGHSIPGLENVGGAAGMGAILGGAGGLGAGANRLLTGRASTMGVRAGLGDMAKSFYGASLPAKATAGLGAAGAGAMVFDKTRAAASNQIQQFLSNLGMGDVARGPAASGGFWSTPPEPVPTSAAPSPPAGPAAGASKPPMGPSRSFSPASPPSTLPPGLQDLAPGASGAAVPAPPPVSPTPKAPASPAASGTAQGAPATPPGAAAPDNNNPLGFIAKHWETMPPWARYAAIAGLAGLAGGGLAGNRGISSLGILAMLAGIFGPQLQQMYEKQYGQAVKDKVQKLPEQASQAAGQTRQAVNALGEQAPDWAQSVGRVARQGLPNVAPFMGPIGKMAPLAQGLYGAGQQAYNAWNS